MTKDELREQALQHLERIPPEEKDFEAATTLFHEHVAVKAGQVVAAYWPMTNEFDARYIIDDLLQRGATIALPVTQKPERVMRFHTWDGKSDLARGDYGVMIPKDGKIVDPDILVVPMLAFDRKGNRLGRGAGHYDATLEDLRKRKDVLAVGVAYASQIVLFGLPTEEHDQTLDLVVTPSGVHDFRN